MATTAETITAAMQLIDPKKEELKKAFDDLQSHTDVLSLISFSWSDLDSHFTSLQTSLSQKLHLLQTLESQSPTPQTLTTQDASPSNSPTQLPKIPFFEPTQIESDPNSSTQMEKDPTLPTRSSVEVSNSDELDPVAPRAELVAFCERMDAIGLRKYMNETKSNRNTMRLELVGALPRAPDPALIVLNAMEGFYVENKGCKDVELNCVRRAGVLLLEVLCEVAPNVGVEVREKARKLAVEWKGKVSLEGENQFEPMGFLHLVAVFGLMSEFDMDELVDHIVVISRYRQATDLCRRLGLGDKITGRILS